MMSVLVTPRKRRHETASSGEGGDFHHFDQPSSSVIISTTPSTAASSVSIKRKLSRIFADGPADLETLFRRRRRHIINYSRSLGQYIAGQVWLRNDRSFLLVAEAIPRQGIMDCRHRKLHLRLRQYRGRRRRVFLGSAEGVCCRRC